LNQKIAKGQATRQHLVTIALRLFARTGFAATSIEAVMAAAGASRGALYHHFDSKTALFEAVLERVEADIAHSVVTASRGIADPIEALRAGCNAWFDLAREPAVRQIVLVDAPSVVGWTKWREIDARHGFGLMKAALKNAAKAGRLGPELASPELIEMLAHMLLASVLEIALIIARSDDPVTAKQEGRLAFETLIDRLFAH
jgi:AcrR family transcriptional regulator